MESFATPYPLIFSDGDQEIDKGHIGIHSVLSFKRFQAQLSRLIGQPASQLSAVFVCRRTARDSEKRQKLPINENTNFNIILNQHNPSKERDCHFLVSLKKSKKERKVARKKNTEAENLDDDDSTSSRGDTSPAGERPQCVADDGFPSPSSVLEPAPEQDVSSSEPLAVSPDNMEATLEELEVVDESKVVLVEAEPKTPEPEDLQLPVTRIGGEPLHRSLVGEQAKFGPVGAIGSQQQTAYRHHHFQAVGEATGQARFKDLVPPSQHQGLVPGRLVPVQRLNNISVFSSDGSNMRLLANGPARGMSSNQSFQAGVPNFHLQQQHFQQQQARYLNRPVREVIVREAAAEQQFCQDCLSYKERNIRPPPFHCCINDRITTGFRGPSPAGPIERPIKRQVKAAA